MSKHYIATMLPKWTTGLVFLYSNDHSKCFLYLKNIKSSSVFYSPNLNCVGRIRVENYIVKTLHFKNLEPVREKFDLHLEQIDEETV